MINVLKLFYRAIIALKLHKFKDLPMNLYGYAKKRCNVLLFVVCLQHLTVDKCG